MKKLLSLGLIVFLIASTLGCVLIQPKPSEVTHGLVDLIMSPLNKADPKQKEYSADLSGDLQKMMDERSSEGTLVLSVKDYSGLDNLGVSQYLQGAELRFETAYDNKTGDGSLKFNGLGLVNGTVAIHDKAVAIDLSQYLGSLIIINFESALNFGKGVNLSDRMEDFAKAINPDAKTTSETLTQLQTLLYKYADIAAKQINPSSIKTVKDTLSIMGKDTKVEKQSISFDNVAMKAIVKAVLEEAVNDQALVDFMVSNYPNTNTGTTTDDLKKQIHDSIQNSLDNLDSNFDGTTMNYDIDLFYTYSGPLSSIIPGLPFQKKNPVAIQINYTNGDTTNNLFYKFVQDGRALDFSISFDSGTGPIAFYLTNIRKGNQYVMDGKLTMPDDTYSLTVNGTTTLSSAKETGAYNISISTSNSSAPFDTINLAITSELTQVKKGSSYETTGTISANTNLSGQPVAITLGLDGTWNFSNNVTVALPDFNDSTAKQYDSFEKFITDLASGQLTTNQ
jgi:hypothetical protein